MLRKFNRHCGCTFVDAKLLKKVSHDEAYAI